MFANSYCLRPPGTGPYERRPKAWSRPDHPEVRHRRGAAPQRSGSRAMQGILELGLSPESRGGTPANPPQARRIGRKPAGAPARPLPVLGIGDATVRPFQSFAVQRPSGKEHPVNGKASHVFVEFAAAGPGQGVVAKLRPTPPTDWTTPSSARPCAMPRALDARSIRNPSCRTTREPVGSGLRRLCAPSLIGNRPGSSSWN